MHELVMSGWHWRFGWLRRPELDSTVGFCYEEPDGDLIFTPRKDHFRVCYLDVWRDEHGKKYLAFNKSSLNENVKRDPDEKLMWKSKERRK